MRDLSKSQVTTNPGSHLARSEGPGPLLLASLPMFPTSHLAERLGVRRLWHIDVPAEARRLHALATPKRTTKRLGAFVKVTLNMGKPSALQGLDLEKPSIRPAIETINCFPTLRHASRGEKPRSLSLDTEADPRGLLTRSGVHSHVLLLILAKHNS